MIHFYCFHNDRKIIASDLPIEKIKVKFGYRYEILTSVKDKESVGAVTERLRRNYPTFIIEEHFKKVHRHTEDAKRRIALARTGKKWDEETKKKISNTMKGKSNFEGKRHTEETKKQMAVMKLGNKHVRDTFWVHDPKSDAERRVRDKSEIPEGFQEGRDYYSTEPGLYYFVNRLRKE